MAEKKLPKGDDGMGFDDSDRQILYGKYSAYRGYLDNGFSHKESLRISGLSNEEYEQMADEFEIEIDEEQL